METFNGPNFTNMHDNCDIMCMLICFCGLYVISYEIVFLTLQLNLMFATFKSYSTVAEKGLKFPFLNWCISKLVFLKLSFQN